MVSCIIPAGVPGREAELAAAIASLQYLGFEYEVIVIPGPTTCGQAWIDGAEDSEGDYLWFLSDDIELRRDSYVGSEFSLLDDGKIVCPVLYNVNGSMQGAGGFGDTVPHDGIARVCAFPLMSRTTWEEIGAIPPFNHFCDVYITDWARSKSRGPLVRYNLALIHKIVRMSTNEEAKEYEEWLSSLSSSD